MIWKYELALKKKCVQAHRLKNLIQKIWLCWNKFLVKVQVYFEKTNAITIVDYNSFDQVIKNAKSLPIYI